MHFLKAHSTEITGNMVCHLWLHHYTIEVYVILFCVQDCLSFIQDGAKQGNSLYSLVIKEVFSGGKESDPNQDIPERNFASHQVL